eukprot:1815749-Prymnesium_polylepis.1
MQFAPPVHLRDAVCGRSHRRRLRLRDTLHSFFTCGDMAHGATAGTCERCREVYEWGSTADGRLGRATD